MKTGYEERRPGEVWIKDLRLGGTPFAKDPQILVNGREHLGFPLAIERRFRVFARSGLVCTSRRWLEIGRIRALWVSMKSLRGYHVSKACCGIIRSLRSRFWWRSSGFWEFSFGAPRIAWNSQSIHEPRLCSLHTQPEPSAKVQAKKSESSAKIGPVLE